MGREPLRYTLQKGSTVFTRWVREDAVLTARRGRWMPAMLVSFLVWVVVAPVHAQDPPPVTVGAGLQTSFLHHRPADDAVHRRSERRPVNHLCHLPLNHLCHLPLNHLNHLPLCHLP